MARFGKSGSTQRLAGRSLAQFIRLTHRTSDVTHIPEDLPQRLGELQPAIIAFWHGQFMMIPALSPNTIKPHSMVARHNDAEMIGQVLESFNMAMIRGAGAGERKRDRGGASALRAALRVLSSGECVTMTADVPPGPARKAGEGIITIARMSGCPIVPCAVASSRFRTLNTWSRMTINLPFSRIAAVIGEPIYVDRDAAALHLEAKRQEVEDALNIVTEKAYSAVGRQHQLDSNRDYERRRTSRLISTYVGVTRAATKLVGPRLLKRRIGAGKEDPARHIEKMGFASQPRPEGTLVHWHAASVGELNAVLPLIGQLQQRLPHLKLIVTSGTRTSAKVAEQRLPEGAIHQFAPLDFPEYQQRFFDHWAPDLTIIAESEVWPNLVLEASKRNIPLALVNARMSKSSARNWKFAGRAASPLFARFSLILTQTPTMAKRFRSFGAPAVKPTGNLKIDSPKLPIKRDELQKLQQQVGKRRVFVAASTHPPEEEIVLKTLKQIAQSGQPATSDLLTVIVPRHPERGDDITDRARQAGINTAQRSNNEPIAEHVQLYVADTIGELGTFYELADVAFIGGSLGKRGGQNPIEAVRFSTPIISGPHTENFAEAYGALRRRGGIGTVRNATELASMITVLLSDEIEAKDTVVNANAALNELSGALPQTITHLLDAFPFLKTPPASSSSSSAGSTSDTISIIKSETGEPAAEKTGTKQPPTKIDETRAS